jgi:hypothetical protein
MSSNPTPRLVTELKPAFEVRVDLDDRAFLFPAGKAINQLVFGTDGRRVYVDGVFPFNQARTPPRILVLTYEEAREFGRKLVEAVHTTRTQLVVTGELRLTINVVPNGYYLQIGDLNGATEMFLSTACIWRVCQGLLRIVDLIAPNESN